MGSWPALSEVVQKPPRKDVEKDSKPSLRGDGVVGGGGGGEEGEGVGRERRAAGGGGGGGGGGERRVSGGGGMIGGGGGVPSVGVSPAEKASDGETNGDSQRYSGRKKGKVQYMTD